VGSIRYLIKRSARLLEGKTVKQACSVACVRMRDGRGARVEFESREREKIFTPRRQTQKVQDLKEREKKEKKEEKEERHATVLAPPFDHFGQGNKMVRAV
jgi:hypothetical protein